MSIHQNFAQQGLLHPREDWILGGVCAGEPPRVTTTSAGTDDRAP